MGSTISSPQDRHLEKDCNVISSRAVRKKRGRNQKFFQTLGAKKMLDEGVGTLSFPLWRGKVNFKAKKGKACKSGKDTSD